MLRSATWIYFLLSLLHASSIALVQEAQAFFIVSLSCRGNSWKAVFSTNCILLGSSWCFPKTPFTLEVFISSCVKSSLTRFAHRFFLEQLVLRIWKIFIVLKSVLLLSIAGKSKSIRSSMSFGE